MHLSVYVCVSRVRANQGSLKRKGSVSVYVFVCICCRVEHGERESVGERGGGRKGFDEGKEGERSGKEGYRSKR